jgi:hypothetical protein
VSRRRRPSTPRSKLDKLTAALLALSPAELAEVVRRVEARADEVHRETEALLRQAADGE